MVPTGQPPFVAEHVAAVLIRILFEGGMPAVLRPELPSATALLARLLTKDPLQQPADAGRCAPCYQPWAISQSRSTTGHASTARGPCRAFANRNKACWVSSWPRRPRQNQAWGRRCGQSRELLVSLIVRRSWLELQGAVGVGGFSASNALVA